MEEMFVIALRLVFAVLWGLCEALPYIPFDLGYNRATERVPIFVVLVLYFAAGCALGGISLWILPSAAVRIPELRVVTLLTSPLFGGLVGILSARFLSTRTNSRAAIHHFWPGFLFALGLSAIRFTYCSR